MFGKPLKLFRIFGFQVNMDWSWLIVMALIVWSLAGTVFPAQFAGLPIGIYLLMGVAAALGMFASIVAHELAHALAARQFGLPMKGITLFLFGGVAEMTDEPPSPKAEFWIAIAGPLASVGAGAAFLATAALGGLWNWPATVPAVLGWIGVINLILAVFNLIPGFPMDGGRVLRAGLWAWKHNLNTATRIASRVGAGFGLVLIVFGILEVLLVNPIGGVWMIMIGMFIRRAAQQSYRQLLVKQVLRGQHVRAFMNDHPLTVSPQLDLEHLVSDHVYRHHHTMFPVVDDGRLVGRVTTRQLQQVPQALWREHDVAQVAEPATEDNTIRADEDAMVALNRMGRDENQRLMVVDGEKLVGIVSIRDLLKFLTLTLELENEQDTGTAPLRG